MDIAIRLVGSTPTDAPFLQIFNITNCFQIIKSNFVNRIIFIQANYCLFQILDISSQLLKFKNQKANSNFIKFQNYIQKIEKQQKYQNKLQKIIRKLYKQNYLKQMQIINSHPLKQQNYNQPYTHSSINHWLVVSPRQITLHGMILTANFNIQNAHQHLAIKYSIKSYINSEQIPFLQIFPQEGKIMRGQIKKIRVKFAKQYKPELEQNSIMKIKIFVTLNTEFNRQYMKTNKLSGWEQIKDLPVEQYELPVRISHDFRDIKQNIRQSVMFQSEFGKVSQDMSSLYGEEKFQIPEIAINSRQNLVKSKQKPRYSQIKKLVQSRRSLPRSQIKDSKNQKAQNQKPKQVYFGNEPKFTQSRIQQHNDILASKNRFSHRSRSQSRHQSPKYGKPDPYQVNYFKKNNNINSSKLIMRQSQSNIFKQFSPQKNPDNPKGIKMKNPFVQNQQNSQVSILRSLQSKNSRYKDFRQGYNEQNRKYPNQQATQQLSIFKQYKTVQDQFQENRRLAMAYQQGNMNMSRRSNNRSRLQGNQMTQQYRPNQRSMQLIVLAIIAGLFVALGSNVGKLFH